MPLLTPAQIEGIGSTEDPDTFRIMGKSAYDYYFEYCTTCIPDFAFMVAVMGEAWVRQEFGYMRIREWALVQSLRPQADPDAFPFDSYV